MIQICPNCGLQFTAPAGPSEGESLCPACRTDPTPALLGSGAAMLPPARRAIPREAKAAARAGFITGALLFGAVTWLGMPAEPLLNVWLKILLWPAGLVNSVMGGPASGWVIIALAKFISLVSVGAFFAYLFFSLRLNAGLAVSAFALTAGVSWWLWVTYIPTWATAPPPLWMIVFLWPGKLLGTALQDAGAGPIDPTGTALLAMASMTGLVYATVICGVRTALMLATGGPETATSGGATPSPSSELAGRLGAFAGRIVNFFLGPSR